MMMMMLACCAKMTTTRMTRSGTRVMFMDASRGLSGWNIDCVLIAKRLASIMVIFYHMKRFACNLMKLSFLVYLLAKLL